MACITAPTAILGGSALQGGTSLLGGLLGSDAATSASKAQTSAAQISADTTKEIYKQIRSDLGAYRDVGGDALKSLENMLGSTGYLGSPLDTTSPISTSFAPTQAQLEATPGYQFTKTQGLKAVQNSLAAQGLGKSGAAGVAAAKYATGLADTTYQDQFSNWYNTQQLGLSNWLGQQNLKLSARQQAYNQLAGLVTTGESAAAGTASAGIQTNAQYSNALTTGSTAKAAGIVGSTNALTSSLNSLGSTGSNTGLLLALNNTGMFGTGQSGSGISYGGGSDG